MNWSSVEKEDTVPRSIPNPIGIFLLLYLHLHRETAWKQGRTVCLNILSKYNFRPACFIQGRTVFRFFDTTSHAKTKLARLKAWLETNVNSLSGANNLHQSPFPILIANKSLHEINKKLEEEMAEKGMDFREWGSPFDFICHSPALAGLCCVLVISNAIKVSGYPTQSHMEPEKEIKVDKVLTLLCKSTTICAIITKNKRCLQAWVLLG